jgi:hypothetical protein
MRYGPTAAGLCPNRDQETIPGLADRNNFLSPRRATPRSGPKVCRQGCGGRAITSALPLIRLETQGTGMVRPMPDSTPQRGYFRDPR